MFINDIHDIFCSGTIYENNKEKIEDKLMKNLTKKIARYQIFCANGWQCVKDTRGYYRSIRKINDNEFEICETSSLPKFFETFQLLTRDQMPWDTFFQGYTHTYNPSRTVKDAHTDEEAVEIFREQMDHLERLMQVGWKLKYLKLDGLYELEIPLKVYDFVTPEHLQRNEFNAQIKRDKYQKILNP